MILGGFDLPEDGIDLLVLALGMWGGILCIRGRIQPCKFLASAALLLGLLWGGIGGLGHTLGVIGSALKHHKPYDYRLVSLITTGAVLMVTGFLNVGFSRWIRRGHAWALGVSGAATGALVLYLLLLHPIGDSRKFQDVLLLAIYLCLLLVAWDPPASPIQSEQGAMRHTAAKLALFGCAVQLALASANMKLQPSGPASAATAAFVAGPLHAALLAVAFGALGFAQARALAKRNARAGAQLVWMAASAVLIAAAVRMALVVYLDAAARRGVRVPLPSLLDALLYATMGAAVIAGQRWESWRSIVPKSARSLRQHPS